MDIKDKLHKLSGGEKKNHGEDDGTEERNKYSREEEPGRHHIERKKYGPSHLHGRCRLEELPGKLYDSSSFLMNREEGLDREKLLFLDTETTGLAGGTGTCVFLVGLGYFRGEEFILEQHLMRDFEEELSLLESVRDHLQERPLPVTFNGKTFDIPHLKSRFVLQRLSFPELKYHVDLLHPCRRMWKHLSSCSLNNLEREILSFSREKDIDGSEVPRYFRAYLQNKNSQLLEPILRHNRHDIISLVFLSLHLDRVVRPDCCYDHSAREYFNLGRQLEEADRRVQSIECYERALAETESSRFRTEIERKLSWQYKREDNYEKAVNIWQQMKDEGRGGLFPYIELAKFYEHVQKNCSRALNICEKARVYLRRKRAIISNWKDKREGLDHRIDRLQDRV